MNRLGLSGRPFIFVVDYKQEQVWVAEPDAVDTEEVLYNLNGFTNAIGNGMQFPEKQIGWETRPVSFETYSRSFQTVSDHIHAGNSYLVNLTCATPVRTRILADKKEEAEHATIVDLIRNDLSQVASEVTVSRYRYIDELQTNKGRLLQVSSEIRGKLPDDWNGNLGTMLFSLLPAGSITGAPKKKTMEIIAEAETYQRGFYTGVMGYFDGNRLDSAVMIRFLEQAGDQLLFKSGGGITSQSDLQSEYNEMKQKVYVPIY